jgi:hypothetical protein
LIRPIASHIKTFLMAEMPKAAINIRDVPEGGLNSEAMIGLGFRLCCSLWENVHPYDQRGVMNKASSALLAAAGVTVGLLAAQAPAPALAAVH